MKLSKLLRANSKKTTLTSTDGVLAAVDPHYNAGAKDLEHSGPIHDDDKGNETDATSETGPRNGDDSDATSCSQYSSSTAESDHASSLSSRDKILVQTESAGVELSFAIEEEKGLWMCHADDDEETATTDESESEAWSEVKARLQADAEAKEKADAEANAEVEAEVTSKADAEVKARAEEGAEAEVKAKAEDEAASKADTAAETQEIEERQNEAEAGADAEIRGDANAENKSKAEDGPIAALLASLSAINSLADCSLKCDDIVDKGKVLNDSTTAAASTDRDIPSVEAVNEAKNGDGRSVRGNSLASASNTIVGFFSGAIDNVEDLLFPEPEKAPLLAVAQEGEEVRAEDVPPFGMSAEEGGGVRTKVVPAEKGKSARTKVSRTSEKTGTQENKKKTSSLGKVIKSFKKKRGTTNTMASF